MREFVTRGGRYGGPAPDEDLVTPEHLLHGTSREHAGPCDGPDCTVPADRSLATRLDMLREHVPAVAGRMAELAADNPGQLALMVCGMVVLDSIAFNLMRPKTAAQAFALGFVMTEVSRRLVIAAVGRGYLSFRLRNPDGSFIQLRDVIRENASEDRPDTA